MAVLAPPGENHATRLCCLAEALVVLGGDTVIGFGPCGWVRSELGSITGAELIQELGLHRIGHAAQGLRSRHGPEAGTVSESMNSATENEAVGATRVGESTYPDSGAECCDGFGEMQGGPRR